MTLKPSISKPSKNPELAFKCEKGFCICHVYTTLPRTALDALRKMTTIITEKQRKLPDSNSLAGWQPTSEIEGGKSSLHITLLRGYRAMPVNRRLDLAKDVQNCVGSLAPVLVGLDHLRIFYDAKRTKQFLCFASSLDHKSEFVQNLKRKLRAGVEKFTSLMTEEDETDDTVNHCSFMSRDVAGDFEWRNDVAIINELNVIIKESLGDIPVCTFRIGTICLDMGKYMAEIPLKSA